MLKISRALKNERLMRALTGMNIKEFKVLEPIFNQIMFEYFNNKPRKRAVGGGRKGALRDYSGKLFYILFYLKAYPTYDVAGFIFGADRSQCCSWTQEYLPLLEKALGRTIQLPKRKIRSVEEFFEIFPECKDLFVDGTERRSQRPKKAKKQEKLYSGKKKAHTRKNIIACDENRRILLVSPTKGGRVHDIKQFKKWQVGESIPKHVALWCDKGFTGVGQSLRHDGPVVTPHKKPRGKELSSEQREDNKIICGIRMVVEHAIGGVKRFGSMSQVYRNKKGQDDQMILICSALWNLHLQYATC
jgi:hypothetical protein